MNLIKPIITNTNTNIDKNIYIVYDIKELNFLIYIKIPEDFVNRKKMFTDVLLILIVIRIV